MDIFKKILSLALLIIVSALPAPAAAMDNEKTKEDECSQDCHSAQYCRKTVHATLGQSLSNWPLALVCLVTDYVDFYATIISSDSHCIFVNNGVLLTWGSNAWGKLGYGTECSSSIPQPVELKNVVQVIAHGGYNLAFAEEGILYEWGLGYGKSTLRPKPTPLKFKEGIEQMAIATNEVLVLTRKGEVFTWDFCYGGKFSRNNLTIRRLQRLPSVVQIVAKDTCIAALTNEGRMLIWGFLGSHQFEFEQAQIRDPIIQMAIGEFFIMALSNKGEVWAWGGGYDGELGNGTLQSSWVPVQVEINGRVTQIAAGDRHALALTEKGEIFAWGHGDYGQLGFHALLRCSARPTLLAIKGIVQIAAGPENSLALTENGLLYAWGRNHFGQLGTRKTQKDCCLPVLVQLPKVISPSDSDRSGISNHSPQALNPCPPLVPKIRAEEANSINSGKAIESDRIEINPPSRSELGHEQISNDDVVSGTHSCSCNEACLIL